MSLAAIDKLNILYYGEMELTTNEKKLRIVMASELQSAVEKYYDTVRAIITAEKLDDRKRDLLLAAAVVSLRKAYLGFFDRFYERYVSSIYSGGEPYYGVESWRQKHALDFAIWLTRTARNESNTAFANSHALAVTRTEINAVGNLAALDAAYRSGARFKTWVTFGDNKVRPSHKAVNGTRIPIDEAFTVGNSKLMFPNDTSLGADAEEIVNCRCTLKFDDGKSLTNGNERGIIRAERKIGRSSNGEIPKKDNMMRLSSSFVNPNDLLYVNAKKIKPLDGYSDIVMHGSPTELLAYGNNGEEWAYGAKEAAELIRNSREFCGKPIRLIACQTGALKDGIAQQIADELGVPVLAPTETVTVDIDGEMFVSDNDILSGIWNSSSPEERMKIHETGTWVEFQPIKKEVTL